MKQNLQDYLTNLWLGIKNNTRYLLNVKTKGNELKITEDYNTVFIDCFELDYKEKWDYEIFWPNPFHPEYLIQWTDSNQIEQWTNKQKNEHHIKLNASTKPMFFESISYVIPNAIGVIRTKKSWKYGIFQITAKLPKGKHLWPAIWLAGYKSWPPEIDILEGYSRNNDNYKELTTCIHYRDSNKIHKSFPSKNHRLPIDVCENFIEYSLHWEKDFIKIYYNGYLVLHVRDKKYLNGMFEPQQLILNNACEEKFSETNRTPFIIEKVKILQKFE